MADVNSMTQGSQPRRRKTGNNNTESFIGEHKPLINNHKNIMNNDDNIKTKELKNIEFNLYKNKYTSYWLTSILILKSTAFCYLIAFIVAYYQNEALIGETGIYPYNKYLNRYQEYYALKSNYDKITTLPTLLWFLPVSNDSLNAIAACGIILSGLVVIFGDVFCHFIVFGLLWILYHSLVNVGQLFYGYGWESQLFLFYSIPIFYTNIYINILES